jgi:hypothetical protein
MIVAVDKLPNWAEWFSYATPMYYANSAIDAIAGDGALTQLVLWLIIYGVVVMTLAVLTLSEQET